MVETSEKLASYLLHVFSIISAKGDNLQVFVMHLGKFAAVEAGWTMRSGYSERVRSAEPYVEYCINGLSAVDGTQTIDVSLCFRLSKDYPSGVSPVWTTHSHVIRSADNIDTWAYEITEVKDTLADVLTGCIDGFLGAVSSFIDELSELDQSFVEANRSHVAEILSIPNNS